MKIKVWLITILILLIIAALAFFPVTVTHTEKIASNFDNTYRHLSNLNEWKKWNPELIIICSNDYKKKNFKKGKEQGVIFNCANDSIVITKPVPLSYNVDGFVNNNLISYNLFIIPTSSNNSLQVQTSEKVKLFNYLFPGAGLSPGEKALTGLKKFLEDTKNIYGFTIETEKVKDTVFAIYECTIDSGKLFSTLNEKFKLIDAYIQQNGLVKKGFYSVSYSAEKDSLHLILGIPVNIFASPAGKIHCVEIPKGKMLTGFYEGKFSDKRKIYTGFTRYASDHYKENVGAPFESYINNKLPSSDTSVVQFKFYYPILL